jgi:murein DD-endopeptidase MepM/ murein hydrolase activator NlpD
MLGGLISSADAKDSGRQRRHTRDSARSGSRLGRIGGSLVLGVIVTGLLSIVGDVPFASDDAVRGGRSAAAGLIAVGPRGGEEVPTSLAITSESGPVHPVGVNGEIDYGEIDARFGASRYGHSHEGQDMFAKPGTPLLAVRDGIVVEKGNDGGRGNYVAIYSESEDQTYVYLHMLRPTGLRPGAEVAASAQVGAMGCTGSCYGTHLHFEVRLGKGIERKPIDPLPLLKRWTQVPAERSG